MADLSQGMVLVKTILSLAAVVGLIITLSWAAKKYLRPEKWAGQSLSNIQIIQMFAIEPKKKLLIVEVDGKRMLLGVAENSISSLCILSDTASMKEVSRAAAL